MSNIRGVAPRPPREDAKGRFSPFRAQGAAPGLDAQLGQGLHPKRPPSALPASQPARHH